MKWWGWLVVGFAATLVFIGGVFLLESLGVLKPKDPSELIVGGLLIIWSVCTAVPLVLEAIKAAKRDE